MSDIDWPREFDDGDLSEQIEIPLAYLRVKRSTAKAWLIEFEIDKDLNSVEAWLPKSQCALDENAQVIYVPEWLVFEKELEQYEKE